MAPQSLKVQRQFQRLPVDRIQRHRNHVPPVLMLYSVTLYDTIDGQTVLHSGHYRVGLVCTTDVHQACGQPFIVTVCAKFPKLLDYIARFLDFTHVKAVLLLACNIHDGIPPALSWQRSTSNNLAAAYNQQCPTFPQSCSLAWC